jgi:predicted glycosyltransferase involved in capsule biosynthesis
LLEVKEYAWVLFYSFTIDSRHLVIITSYSFELKEDILSFFWDVDVLIMIWAKESVKIYENIEARVVIPYWLWKQTFLTALGQNIEEVSSYKVKWELLEDTSEFVNLSE